MKLARPNGRGVRAQVTAVAQRHTSGRSLYRRKIQEGVKFSKRKSQRKTSTVVGLRDTMMLNFSDKHDFSISDILQAEC